MDNRVSDRPADWLWNELNSLRGEIKDQHQRLRADMNGGFDRLRTEMQFQNGRVSQNDTRITIIETQRAEEAKVIIKRSAWASLLAATGLTGVVEFVRHYWK